MLGTSRNTVTNYELEHTPPDRMKSIVLRKWAEITGVDFGWLRTGLPFIDLGPDSTDRIDELIVRLAPLARKRGMEDYDVIAWLMSPTTYRRDADRPVVHLEDPDRVEAIAAKAGGVIW